MKKRDILLFGFSLVCVALQFLILYSWGLGLLDHFVRLYQTFGKPVPSITQFTYEKIYVWWFVCYVSFIIVLLPFFSRSRTLWALLAGLISLLVLSVMAYIMYPFLI